MHLIANFITSDGKKNHIDFTHVDSVEEILPVAEGILKLSFPGSRLSTISNGKQPLWINHSPKRSHEQPKMTLAEVKNTVIEIASKPRKTEKTYLIRVLTNDSSVEELKIESTSYLKILEDLKKKVADGIYKGVIDIFLNKYVWSDKALKTKWIR